MVGAAFNNRIKTILGLKGRCSFIYSLPPIMPERQSPNFCHDMDTLGGGSLVILVRLIYHQQSVHKLSVCTFPIDTAASSIHCGIRRAVVFAIGPMAAATSVDAWHGRRGRRRVRRRCRRLAGRDVGGNERRTARRVRRCKRHLRFDLLSEVHGVAGTCLDEVMLRNMTRYKCARTAL